jgi:hypothetical protein
MSSMERSGTNTAANRQAPDGDWLPMPKGQHDW